MTKTEKRIKFFEFFSKLTEFSKQSNIHFLVTSYHRTDAEQMQLYKDGKSMCDGVIKRSAHQDWLAIDIVLVSEGDLLWSRNPEYEALGAEWESMGGIWGGKFGFADDIYHFQWSDSLV